VNPEHPLKTIQQLKEENPETHKFLNSIIQQIVYHYRRHMTPDLLNIGLEATIESVERLIDTGHIKIFYDDENKTLKVGIWNGEEYI